MSYTSKPTKPPIIVVVWGEFETPDLRRPGKTFLEVRVGMTRLDGPITEPEEPALQFGLPCIMGSSLVDMIGVDGMALLDQSVSDPYSAVKRIRILGTTYIGHASNPDPCPIYSVEVDPDKLAKSLRREAAIYQVEFVERIRVFSLIKSQRPGKYGILSLAAGNDAFMRWFLEYNFGSFAL